MNRRSFFLRALATGAAMVPIKIKTIHAAEPSAPAAPPAIEDPEERLLAETIHALHKMDNRAIRAAVRNAFPGVGKFFPSDDTPVGKFYLDIRKAIQDIRWPDGLFNNVSTLNRGQIDYDAVIKPFHDRLISKSLGTRYLGFALQTAEDKVSFDIEKVAPGSTRVGIFQHVVGEAGEYRPDGGRAEFVFLGHEYSPDRFVGLAAP